MKTDHDLAIAADTLYRAFINHEPGVEPEALEHAAFTLRVAATAHPNETIRELAADIGIAATASGPDPMRLATAALTAELDYTQPGEPDRTQLRLFELPPTASDSDL